MTGLSSAVPTMTLDLHALIASIARTLQHTVCIIPVALPAYPLEPQLQACTLWQVNDDACSAEDMRTSMAVQWCPMHCLMPSGSLAAALRCHRLGATRAPIHLPRRTWCYG